jgi:hypothetical protein
MTPNKSLHPTAGALATLNIVGLIMVVLSALHDRFPRLWVSLGR